MKVDGSANIDLHVFQNSRPSSQTQESTASMASSALAEVRAEALEETIEGLSLGLSSTMKRLNLGDKVQDPMMNSLEKLLQQMDKMARDSVNRVSEQLSQLKDGGQILAALDKSGLSQGDTALVLTSLLSFKGLDPAIKKQLKKRLSEIMAQEDIELEILASTQGMKLDKEGLRAVRQLYQHAKRGEKGLAHWFELLERHKDRAKYIQILIRSMAEPLDEGQRRDDMTMVAATIRDLRRLLLFLTFEEHCAGLARTMGLGSDVVMSLTIELLEQSWVYPDALAVLIGRLSLGDDKKIVFLRRWKDLMTVMSESCYRDPEQKEHVQEVMLELSEQWND